MLVFFIILIILVSAVLALIVLVQNPKGGGLAGSLAGFSNQIMGVKQTTDVLEKGTWLFAALVGILCLFSPVFINGSGHSKTDIDKASTNAPANTSKTPTTPSLPTAPNK